MTYFGEHLPCIAGVGPIKNVEHFHHFLWKIVSTALVVKEGKE